MYVMMVNLHDKNQLNICKHLREKKKVRKIDIADDRRTECKPKVPFGIASKNKKYKKVI